MKMKKCKLEIVEHLLKSLKAILESNTFWNERKCFTEKLKFEHKFAG